MAIVKMKRLRLLAMEGDKNPILSRLQRLGCVQIDQPDEKIKDPQWAQLVQLDGARLGETRALHDRMKAALAALNETAPVKTSIFAPRRAVTAEQLFDDAVCSQAQAAAQIIDVQSTRIRELYEERGRLTAQRETLAPWLGLDLDLGSSGTQNVSYQLLTVPVSESAQQMQQALEQETPLAQLILGGRDAEFQYFLLIAHRTVQQQALDALKKFGTSKASLQGWQGTPQENTRRLNQQLDRVEQDLQAARAKITEQGPHREALQLAIDRLEQDLSRGQAIGSLLATQNTFYLEGWVSAPQLPQVEKLLAKYPCAYETADPVPEEDPPVQLKNNKLTYPLNMVTEMYALPTYDGIDPSPLIVPFFTLFFGIMYADLGYGLVLVAISLFVLKFCHFRGMMDQMFRLMLLCGITTAGMGFAFGGFFGDVLMVVCRDMMGLAPQQIPGWVVWFSNGPLFNPMNDPMRMMVFSLVLGVVHLLAGMCIHMYMEARDGQWWEGALDVIPWWILFAGFGLGAAKKIWWLALAGVAALILTQGRHKKGVFGKLLGGVTSLYDVTSYLSDVLSYLRLMALVLATSVIASVVNTLGAMTGLIGFLVVFLIGHAFNMGINIIGTYVHAARLQYLEFFGKFYKEGGRPFTPLKIDTYYVDVIKEEK